LLTEISIPNYWCVLRYPENAGQCAVKRPKFILGRSDAGGNTHQQPSSCRKKSSARDPRASAVSTHTYRLPPKRVRLNSVTRTGVERLGASHLSTCVRSEYSCVDFMCSSGKRLLLDSVSRGHDAVCAVRDAPRCFVRALSNRPAERRRSQCAAPRRMP
jgi:hypothetical protein